MPVVAEIAAEYSDEVTFVAVAGRSDLPATEEAAAQLFGDALMWGLDDSIWGLYGVRSQPTTVLLAGNDVIVDSWFGLLDSGDIRTRLDELIAISS